MIITSTSLLPNDKELKSILQKEFSSKLSYSLTKSKQNSGFLVRYLWFPFAQINIKGQEIEIKEPKKSFLRLSKVLNLITSNPIPVSELRINLQSNLGVFFLRKYGDKEVS